MTADERGAIAQLLGEMSLLLAVSNIYLAGRYAEIVAGFHVDLSLSDDDLEAKRKMLHSNLATSCIPVLLVNAAAVFLFIQPIATGKIPARELCAWGCDVFPLAYVLLVALFVFVLAWSSYLSWKTWRAIVRISHKLNPPPVRGSA